MNELETWGTWDVECLNAVMKVPELAEVRVALYDVHNKRYYDRLLWKYIARIGERSVDGTYFELALKLGEQELGMTFAADGDSFVYRITPARPWTRLRLHICGLLRWNQPGTVARYGQQLMLETAGRSYEIDVLGQPDEETAVNATHAGVLVHAEEAVYIRCNNKMTVAEMEHFLARKRQSWLTASVKGEGVLATAPEAIVKGMTWNTIYDPTKQRYCTPVTREWCVMDNMTHFGGYVLFSWDTFLGGLLAGVQNKALAYRQVYSVLEEMQQAFAPQYGSQVLTRWDRSNPPVGAYCVLKLYRQFGDLALLENVYDKLKGWNAWWMTHRDGNGDGLLEWGSDRDYVADAASVLGESFEVASRMESGLDNSPMYDGVAYNVQGRTLELADVGLNALYALDCEALAAMARLLGRTADAEQLEAERERVRVLVNDALWHESLGIYCNRHWDDRLSEVLTPTCFYPLAAGLASPEQAKRMVEEHLLNEEEFWGRYVLPSVMKNHPSFEDNDYWRGRIWGPMNFFVYEGLKRYGYHELAGEVASRSLRMFQAEWQADSHIHENYNALTGDGDDVDNADPLYTWGGLLPYLYVQELIEAQQQGGVRFGHGREEAAGIEGLPLADGLYRVVTGATLEVWRNGKRYIRTDVPARVILTPQPEGWLLCEVHAAAEGTLELWPGASVAQVGLRRGGAAEAQAGLGQPGPAVMQAGPGQRQTDAAAAVQHGVHWASPDQEGKVIFQLRAATVSVP